jgi:hypothetical protein
VAVLGLDAAVTATDHCSLSGPGTAEGSACEAQCRTCEPTRVRFFSLNSKKILHFCIACCAHSIDY